jgi:glycerophosphoryl diester phosphodiesterase
MKGNGEEVEKKAIVNLLEIADPNRIAHGERGDIGIGKRFGFPFATIESLIVLGEKKIGVLNDNNYPFGLGRHQGTGQPDDNEFIIIKF